MNSVLVINILFLCTIGTLTLRNNKSTPNSRWFSILHFSLSIWVGTYFIFKNHFFPGYMPFVLRLEMLAAVTFSFSSYFFCRLAIAQMKIGVRDYLIAGLSCSMVAVILFSKSLIIYTPDIPADVAVTGLHYRLLSLYFVTMILIVIGETIRIAIYIRSKRSAALAILIGILLFSLTAAGFNLILPSLGYSQFLPLGYIGTIFLSTSFFFAIAKFNLLNSRIIVPRFVSHAISLGIVVIFVAMVPVVSRRLQILETVLYILFGFVLTTYGSSWRESIQTSTERLWLRDWYDPQTVIKELSKALSPLFNREHLFLAAAKVLDEVMHLRKVTIIFHHTPETTDTGFSVYNKSGTHIGHLSPNSAISQFFGNPTSALRTSQIPQTLLSEITPFETELHIIVPLYSPDGFEGLIILGKRDSEAPYSAKDIALLDTVAATIGVFLDRMRPYEKIQDDFNRNQKKLYDLELQIARSEKIASVMLALKKFNHELKTPLSITRMMIDQLPETDSSLHTFKTDALHQIDRATAIVRQTLSLSEPKARTVAPVDLIPIIHEATKVIPERITLTTELAQLPIILGVEDDLVSLLNNLIKNACEAIESTGTIRISGHVDPEHVFISITDSGCGISHDELPKIWDPFFVGYSKKTDGHGLGLSIAFRIVREHLGHISVNSTPGRGTTFIVQVPI